MKKQVAVLSAFVIAAVLPCVGQNVGSITGTVTDASGGSIHGASVGLFLPGGASRIAETTTTAEGLFTFTNLKAEYYDLEVESQGFLKYKTRQVKVDTGRETALPAIKLDVAAVQQSIEVTADPPAVQTTAVEVSTVVTNAQVSVLPMLDRSASPLVLTQPGVVRGRSGTVINGQRASYSNVTIDGINIQDNLFRDASLDDQPNLLLLDQVDEFSISMSNAPASKGFGSSQLAYSTPSGGNDFHGNLYWYNRNNAVAANTWFNNRDGVAKPFLNQTEAGFRLGGPIIKDKLLFYTNYEAWRRRRQRLAQRTILTTDARNGIYTYRDNAGNVQKVNLLQLVGINVDPAISQFLAQIPGPENINNFRSGDSSAALLRNSAGYSFNLRDNRDRDNLTAKLDYIISPSHSIAATYLWNRDTQDRADVVNDFSPIPKVANDYGVNAVAIAWRWTPTSRLTNAFRGGFNLAPAPFNSTETFPPYIIDAPFMQSGTLVSNPLNLFRSEGRNTDTYSISNDASYLVGAHTLQFGYQGMRMQTFTYADAGITPAYNIGIGGFNPRLREPQLPGISANDLSLANSLLALLGGYVSAYSQTFNAANRTSGFVPGAADRRAFQMDTQAGYLQDTWKFRPTLTFNLGLRYEYYSPVDELNGLVLMPRGYEINPISALLDPNGVLDFAGNAVGRPFYRKDLNNFAPNVGFAWDPTGAGKTAIRAGYSINYVNDSMLAAARNTATTGDGLQAVSANGSTVSGRLSTSRPAIPVPQYKVPRTYLDNWSIDDTAAYAAFDPNLRTPYVQQWSFGIQHEVLGTVFEARYVGNKTTKALRAIDFNQLDLTSNGFLDDFVRARNNGYLARAATGVFDPEFNSNIPGSQRLTVFPRLKDGGLLGQEFIRAWLQTGEAGELASQYHRGRYTNDVPFVQNPNGLGANLMTNYSNASYNSLQLQVTRRTRNGNQFQGSYTWGKVLSDGTGDNQLRFEPFLDNGNRGAERARAAFDVTHMLKGNWVAFLPFGRNQLIDLGRMNWLLGGWSTSGILTLQSGLPFSILSERGTVNRFLRATQKNTVDPLLHGDALDDVIGLFMTGDGPLFINPSARDANGRGAAADGAPAFAGQAFANPQPGAAGVLQRRMFSSPWVSNLDLGLQKRFPLTDRQSVEVRMEAFNALNHPSFWVGDETASAADTNRFNINNPSFGRITTTFYDRRRVQFALFYRF